MHKLGLLPLQSYWGFAMAVWGPGTPELWEKLIEAAFTVFVGGGFLRDAATALANRN